MNLCFLLSLIICLTFVSYAMDVFIDGQYRECRKKARFHAILWTHHFVFWYLLLGWMSTDKRFLVVYLIFAVCVLIDWKMNHGSCSLTLRLNSVCQLPSDRVFRDAMYWLGIKDWFNGKLYNIYMVCVVILVSIKLIR